MEETKATEQTESIKEAKISESIPLDELKPGQLRIIKRNGKVVLFDVSKIEVAITKAFLAVYSSTAAASSSVHQKVDELSKNCLLYTSPSPRDQRGSRMAGGG